MNMQSLIVAFGVALLATSAIAKPMTDAQVRQAIIRESIASYPGNCPCPYNSARNGSACGGRSAYSRAGGNAPMCYPRDVSQEQVEAYRRAQGASKP